MYSTPVLPAAHRLAILFSLRLVITMKTWLLRLLHLVLLLLPPRLRDHFPASQRPGGAGLDVYHPIIMFAGFGCSDLEARLTEAYTPSLPRCGALKGKGWFSLYQYNNTWDIVRHHYLPCFKEQASLVYDPALNDYRNLPGVEVRVPNFGSAYALGERKISPDREKLCLASLREEIEALGYRDGDTLFGAPYDMRHAPPPPGQPSKVYSDYFARVMELVQHASKKNQGSPVILVGHSFGGRVVLDFLNSTPLPWRKKHIKHLLLIAPAVPTGFTLTITHLTAGPSVLPVATVPSMELRALWRTFASSLLAMPSPVAFGDKPIVITQHRNYSAYDMEGFLLALGFSDEETVPFVKRVLPTMLNVQAPLVPTTYIIGTGNETPEQLVFWEGNFDVAPQKVYGDGDGSINLVSMLAFEKELHRQQNQNNVPYKFVAIANATHVGIIKQEHFLRRVMIEILEANR